MARVFSPAFKPPPPASVREAWGVAEQAQGDAHDTLASMTAPRPSTAPPPWATAIDTDAAANQNATSRRESRRGAVPNAPNNAWATNRNPILIGVQATPEEPAALVGAEHRISRGSAPYTWASRRDPILDGDDKYGAVRYGVKRVEHTVRAPGPVGKAAPRPPPNMAGLPSGARWGGRQQPALGAGSARPQDEMYEDVSRRHKTFTANSHILQTVHDRDVLGQAGYHGIPVDARLQAQAASSAIARDAARPYTPLHLRDHLRTDGDAVLPQEGADYVVPRQMDEHAIAGGKPHEDHLVGAASLVNASVRDMPIPNRRGVGPPRNEVGVVVTSKRIWGDVDEDFRPRGRDHHPECLPTSDFVNVVNYRFSGGICPQTRHTDDSKRRERRAIESALYERAAAYHAERAGRIQVAVGVRDALIASARR